MPAWQLAIRLCLELAALVALGSWAFQAAGQRTLGWVAGVGLPALAAGAWATFAVPGDPSRSGRAPIPIAGWVRLSLELALFLGAAAALRALHRTTALVLFLVALLVHHGITPARHRWLLRQ
jgi:hypothetical protein